MALLVVNCQKVRFARSLGVSSFLVQLCSALANKNKLIFVLPDLTEFDESPARSAIEESAHDIISFDEAQRRVHLWRRKAVELLPHHFQEPCLCDRSVLICHDLHIFDIGWKYKKVEKIRDSFRENLLNASVVITEFPRTYYTLERTAGITIMNLFLTESPLLLDTRPRVSPVTTSRNESLDVPELIYPAQLQLHKNHEVLIRAAEVLKARGQRVRLVCPGSDFDERVTESLNGLIRRCGVQEEVDFPGRLSESALLDLYRHCDGVIVPSLAEGGAYVAMEAIAAQKPVAVNDFDSARLHLKAVAAEVLWFDATDVGKTAEAIKELAKADKAEWARRNVKARDRIDRMTWENVADKWNILIDWLMGKCERPIMSVDKDGWGITYLN